MTDVVEIDHVSLGLSRVTMQYKDASKFKAWLSAVLALSNEQESCLLSMRSLSLIDEMEGANLDVIGFVVGADRIVDNVVEGSTVLTDAQFRVLIRARIARNHSHGLPEEILAGLSFILQQETPHDFNIVLVDYGGMSFGISIGRELTTEEHAVLSTLDILPRPQGVWMCLRQTYDDTSYFGFAGQPGATNFDDGLFAEGF